MGTVPVVHLPSLGQWADHTCRVERVSAALLGPFGTEGLVSLFLTPGGSKSKLRTGTVSSHGDGSFASPNQLDLTQRNDV